MASAARVAEGLTTEDLRLLDTLAAKCIRTYPFLLAAFDSHEDLRQEAVRHVLERKVLQRYDPGRLAWASWLWIAMRRFALSYYFRRQSQSRMQQKPASAFGSGDEDCGNILEYARAATIDPRKSPLPYDTPAALRGMMIEEGLAALPTNVSARAPVPSVVQDGQTYHYCVRDVFKLTLLGYSQKEIAGWFQVVGSTISLLVCTARRQLREYLQ